MQLIQGMLEIQNALLREQIKALEMHRQQEDGRHQQNMEIMKQIY